jgi:hypothetical protein
MVTSTLSVIHRLPSAIRSEPYIIPDAFCASAERRRHEVVCNPNAILSGITSAQTRIGLVLYLPVVMNRSQLRVELFYRWLCVVHPPNKVGRMARPPIIPRPIDGLLVIWTRTTDNERIRFREYATDIEQSLRLIRDTATITGVASHISCPVKFAFVAPARFHWSHTAAYSELRTRLLELGQDR